MTKAQPVQSVHNYLHFEKIMPWSTGNNSFLNKRSEVPV